MKNKDLDRRALAEVNSVLLRLSNRQINKIPKDLVEAIKFNMDNEYHVDYNNIEKGNMLPDTEKILSTIYANYLSTAEEKIVINKLINISKHKTKIIK